MNTTYFMNLVMDNIFHSNGVSSIPEVYYMGLSSSEPDTDGTGATEPSTNGTGYVRAMLDSLSSPNAGVITNNEPIRFNESLTDWGVMTHYVVYDSENGGNLLFYGQLSLSRRVEQNTSIIIKAGEMRIQLSNPT